MLGSLLMRLVPASGRNHDDLFTPFAPDGAPTPVLRDLYHRYQDAFEDELVPPQHAHYRALTETILGAVHGWERLSGDRLRRVNSAYVACFERSEAYDFQLSLWRGDAAFSASSSWSRIDLVIFSLTCSDGFKQIRFSVGVAITLFGLKHC